MAAAMGGAPRPTGEELLALYRAEREAMLRLVEALLTRNARLEEAADALVARVKHLEDRLDLDSHNSSKPPSSDWGPRGSGAQPARPQPRSLRPPPGTSGRRTGGQPGHPGTTLRLVDTSDRLEVHRPPRRAACGAGLAAAARGTERVGAERCQVVDLPPLALAVTEHRVAHVGCPTCGVETAGAFPLGVSQPVQYGDRLRAAGVYLHDYHLLPYGRTIELLHDLFGAAPSEGTLQTAETACLDGPAATEAAIAAALRQGN